jgi:mevalonate kinase
MSNNSLIRGTVTATAPGKVILFGEHAINRGQPALAAAVGIYARCRVTPAAQPGYRLRSGAWEELVDAATLMALAAEVDARLADADYDAIRRLAAGDYFAPAKYILASIAAHGLPGALGLEWESDIPRSFGLGSGGAAFTAMVAAVSEMLPDQPSLAQRAAWAHRGDIVAHGGVASALDTQTSLHGGVIRLTQENPGQGMAEPLPYASGLSVVIGNTRVEAATSEINGRVRRWLAEQPRRRMAYFEAIGTLARTAIPLLEQGEWAELGRLLSLNQLLLEKIGVSCPEIDTLIDAALEAGAWGAKLSGSGGGGIMIALVPAESQQNVAQAIADAGGDALTPAIGVSGVSSLNP